MNFYILANNRKHKEEREEGLAVGRGLRAPLQYLSADQMMAQTTAKAMRLNVKPTTALREGSRGRFR